MKISPLRNLDSSSVASGEIHSYPKAATGNSIREKSRNDDLYASDSTFDGSYPCSYYALRLSIIALFSVVGLLMILTLPIYAQDLPGRENEERQLEPPGNASDSSNQQDIVLNTTSTNIPVVEQLSDKGTYKVQLRWGQPPSLLPENGFDMEIVFLNASAPPASPQTFPMTETNETGGPTTMGATGYTNPSLIERMVPIQSYDIAVYSDDGQELWKKENQAVQGGRAYERVTLEKPYTGNITVSVFNIKGAGGITGTIADPLSQTSSNITSPSQGGEGSQNGGDNGQQSESVKFSARVVGTSP
jgi:hypothetical protein